MFLRMLAVDNARKNERNGCFMEKTVWDRNVNIITDLKGNRIVLINDIIFKGKRSVNWDDVKNYLETYVIIENIR